MFLGGAKPRAIGTAQPGAPAPLFIEEAQEVSFREETCAGESREAPFLPT